MPYHLHDALLHAMSPTELSRVRTEFYRLRILTTIPPHPVQPNRQLPSHGYLGNAFVPTHRQVHGATSPVRMDARCCLGRLHQQKAQQRIALYFGSLQNVKKIEYLGRAFLCTEVELFWMAI
jgi:hypothetical protein